MFEMKSDLARKYKFDSASKDAKSMGRIPNHTIVERAAMQRGQPITIKKRKIPWFTIITLVTMIPFLVENKSNLMNAFGSNKNEQMTELLGEMGMEDDKPIKLSVEMGDKQIHQKITASDLEAAQSYLKN